MRAHASAFRRCRRPGAPESCLVGKRHFLDLRVGRRGEVERRGGDGPVGDFGGGQFDHGRGARGRVERGAERHSVHGVPGQLGAGDQAAVFARRDPHGVGGLSRYVGGCGGGDVGVLAGMREAFFDFGDRRCSTGVRAGRGGGAVRGGAVRAGLSRSVGLLGGRHVAVEGVGRGVVQRGRLAVPQDLRVALFRLQFQAGVAFRADPQATGGSRRSAGWS